MASQRLLTFINIAAMTNFGYPNNPDRIFNNIEHPVVTLNSSRPESFFDKEMPGGSADAKLRSRNM